MLVSFDPIGPFNGIEQAEEIPAKLRRAGFIARQVDYVEDRNLRGTVYRLVPVPFLNAGWQHIIVGFDVREPNHVYVRIYYDTLLRTAAALLPAAWLLASLSFVWSYAVGAAVGVRVLSDTWFAWIWFFGLPVACALLRFLLLPVLTHWRWQAIQRCVMPGTPKTQLIGQFERALRRR
ncbi:MAG: hypothetical protein IT548_16140 [Alphaproteobacteria bacterium]|nr:hypothetical protein [Alphaproteobacteria bacterium]